MWMLKNVDTIFRLPRKTPWFVTKEILFYIFIVLSVNKLNLAVLGWLVQVFYDTLLWVPRTRDPSLRGVGMLALIMGSYMGSWWWCGVWSYSWCPDDDSGQDALHLHKHHKEKWRNRGTLQRKGGILWSQFLVLQYGNFDNCICDLCLIERSNSNWKCNLWPSLVRFLTKTSHHRSITQG